MVGYKAIGSWAEDLGQKVLARFDCRKRNGYYSVPSRTTFRETLTGVNPEQLDLALQGWNEQFADADEGLAVDGKTMCNAIDDDGRQTHIPGVVGHQTGRCHSKKRVGALPVAGSDELKDSVASTIEKLAHNVRRVFNYLRMSENSRKIILRCQIQEV
jgi:hypothetical protein